MRARGLLLGVAMLSLAVACAPAPGEAGTKQALAVSVRYPLADTQIKMGQILKCIVEVRDPAGNMVPDAQVQLTISDASGNVAAEIPAAVGSGDIYRSEGWTLPHRSGAGTWTITALASSASGEGSAAGTFGVRNSVSEDLLAKYGFWADDPSLGYIDTTVGKEEGDARDGEVFWGGYYMQMHILKESHLEIYWRKGNFQLGSSQQVQDFLLDEVGNPGTLPLRELGEFHAVRFKQWEAWQGTARGRLSQYDIQYMVFYSPEVDKTYALGTMVVNPPTNIDAHATLRDGFEVDPQVRPEGQDGKPRPRLLPAPRLVSPPMTRRIIGDSEPIVLTWKPVQELAKDEYYRVAVDFDYAETTTSRYYTTRSTEFTLPQDLYGNPNCGVFNWQVTLMRQTGVREDGEPIGEAISYNSLHWYVEWLYARAEQAPFTPRCPNPQT